MLGGSKFAIDYYQREYRWETKQVAELLEDQPVDLSIGSDTAPGGRRGQPAARPQLPFDGCGDTQGQEEPLCDAS